MKLIIASANRHKIEEISSILPSGIELISAAEMGVVEDIPETGESLEENALLKADYIYSKFECDCFADDTGLEVDALDGEPGVRSARYATDGHDFEANIDLLLKKLDGIENRKARFRTVIALYWRGDFFTFEGVVNGRILHERSGDGGFGYDSVFMPDGFEESFAQMSLGSKNEISHRGKATKELIKFLNKQCRGL